MINGKCWNAFILGGTPGRHEIHDNKSLWKPCTMACWIKLLVPLVITDQISNKNDINLILFDSQGASTKS
jgi:hypothetical protein